MFACGVIVYWQPMHHPFLPLLLLVLAPLVYFSVRLDAWRHPYARWTLAACALLVVAAGALAGGVDYLYLKRMKLGVAALVTLVLVLRYCKAGGFGDRRRYRVALIILAVISWVIHLNFFAFHGRGSTRVYVHLHDVAHYYLGSKYADELGYADFYIGLVRAESDRHHRRFMSREARDLRTNQLLDVSELLAESHPVKGRFTPERWADFEEDVDFFRQTMGPQYGAVLRDYGYNPSPLWTLIGGSVANLVPAGSETGIVLLSLIDPALEIVLFVAIAWAFGIEAALLSMIYFCALFGASFGWVGGAYLRHLWLFGVVAAVCCVRRGRFVTAGGLLALAALLRIFPAVFVAGIACKAGADLLARHKLDSRHLRFLVSFILGTVVLFTATATRPRGIADWHDFTTNLQRHMSQTAYNTIGLTRLLDYRTAFQSSSADPPADDVIRRRTIYLIQLSTMFPITVLWFAWRCRRESDVDATIMGVVLLFVGLTLTCYYYLILILLILANRDRLDRLALIFAVEVLSYALMLFEDRDGIIYFYRNLLVFFLLVALYLDPITIELRKFAGTVIRLGRG